MTYTVTFTIVRDTKTLTLTTNFAGCQTPNDAEDKARQNYPGLKKIIKVVPVQKNKKELSGDWNYNNRPQAAKKLPAKRKTPDSVLPTLQT